MVTHSQFNRGWKRLEGTKIGSSPHFRDKLWNSLQEAKDSGFLYHKKPKLYAKSELLSYCMHYGGNLAFLCVIKAFIIY